MLSLSEMKTDKIKKEKKENKSKQFIKDFFKKQKRNMNI
jgi:hypothetical protein